MTRRAPSLATALAISLIAVAAAAPGASAGGPSIPTVIRIAPSGTSLQIVDGAAVGGGVTIAWVEQHAGQRDVGLAATGDGGATWGSIPPFEERQAPRVALCSGEDAVASRPRRAEIAGASPLVLGLSALAGSDRTVVFNFAGVLYEVFGPGVDYSRPDVACAPDVRAFGVALFTSGGDTRLWLYSRDLSDEIVDIERDLGPANKGSTPAVAVAGDRLYVAWTQGTRLRFKRFTIGDGPGRPLTGSPTVTIEDTTGQSSPRMAADGKRVVLAWERRGSVVARVSTDRGASFKARTVLFAGAPSTGKVAFVTNADALGSTLIVSGAVSSEGITLRSGVRRTTSGGASWAKVGPERTGGFLIGILGGTATDPRLHLIWDERLGDDPQHIRAQYLDLD